MVAEYVDDAMNVYPAGVAYTHPTFGYRTVNLGFGIESMMGDRTGDGLFETGAFDRVDLMKHIMFYFGIMCWESGIDGAGGPELATSLGGARPNPFNPATTIEYGLAAPGRVALRVYDIAGRLVRTLVDTERESGEHRAVWDGTTDEGLRAASGVYFVRMEAADFSASEKLILLK